MNDFDNIICLCQLPIPDDESCEINFNSLIYQTKDLDGRMETYTISKKQKLNVMGEPYNKTLQMSMYSICKGYWIRYELFIDKGKVIRIELTDYRNKNFQENIR